MKGLLRYIILVSFTRHVFIVQMTGTANATKATDRHGNHAFKMLTINRPREKDTVVYADKIPRVDGSLKQKWAKVKNESNFFSKTCFRTKLRRGT